jgi:hypothetical protein
VVNEGNIRLLAKSSHEWLAHEQRAETKATELKAARAASAKPVKKGAKKKVEALAAVEKAASPFTLPNLEVIAAGVSGFAKTTERLGHWVEPEVAAEAEAAEGEGGDLASRPSNRDKYGRTPEVLHLQMAVLKFPEALQKAARSVLPSDDVHVPEAKVWAPVLGWLGLHGLPSAQAALALYDELQLRHALAETFSGVGVKGEDAWRAAAQVRVLLRVETEASLPTAIETAGFWDDPDVRWLTGVHTDEEGAEYFEQERLEALACWLQLPGLVAAVRDAALSTKAANDVTAIAANLAYAAKIAGYKVKPFVEHLVAGALREAREVTEEPVVKAKKRVVKKTKVVTEK